MLCLVVGRKALQCEQMNILENVSLKDFSTMRLGGTARYAVEITSRIDLTDAVAWAESRQLPMLMIGDGSNIIWKDEGFAGLLLINKIRGFDIYNEDELNTYVTVGAGENWDTVVEATVNDGLSGIEALSLIPGSAGATPVQNVGAYGQEIANVLSTVEVYDQQSKQFGNMQAFECDFGYRTSRFKTIDRGRFFITGLTLHLTRQMPTPPFYRALEDYLQTHGITTYTPNTIRQAVIAIRSAKLPDPKVVANNGSFFANPIVNEIRLVQLEADYPGIPSWPQGNGMVKIPAAWLVEQAGFKGYHDSETGMATWDKQALVLVNEKAQTTADLLKFRQKIIDAVQAKFGITLEQEPELLPN